MRHTSEHGGAMDREDARRWVAEHVMRMERKPCEAGERYWHMAGAFDDGYVSESGSWCRWCGRKVRDGDTTPCQEYPFPHFDLVQLMRRLVEDELFVHIGAGPDGEFAVDVTVPVVEGEYIADTVDPFGDLCKWLAQRYNSDDDQD